MGDRVGDQMGDQRDRGDKPEKAGQGQDRQARLEQALRANLLKRKEKARTAKSPSPRPKEGRQD